jgi:hypothetical protein
MSVGVCRLWAGNCYRPGPCDRGLSASGIMSGFSQSGSPFGSSSGSHQYVHVVLGIWTASLHSMDCMSGPNPRLVVYRLLARGWESPCLKQKLKMTSKRKRPSKKRRWVQTVASCTLRSPHMGGWELLLVSSSKSPRTAASRPDCLPGRGPTTLQRPISGTEMAMKESLVALPDYPPH